MNKGISINLENNKDPDLYANALREYVRNFKVIKEYNAIQAKLWRAKYNTLITEGFTKDEALHLCSRN